MSTDTIVGQAEPARVARPAWLRYGIALFAFALALVLTLWLRPVLDQMPSILFFAAVVISAWYGGLGPGLLASLLSTAAVAYFFLLATTPFDVLVVQDLLGLAVFVLVITLINAVTSAQKRTEDSLRQSEKRFRELVEISPEAIYVHSESKIEFINAAGAKLLGAPTPQQLIGIPVLDIVHPDYHDIVRQRIRQIEEGITVPLIEEKFVRLDGSVVDVEVAAASLTYRGKPAVQVVARDITERKRAEEALRESEARFRLMADTAPVMIWMSGVDGLYGYFNKSWLDFTGRTMEQELGNGWAEGVHPDDFQRCLDVYQTSFDARRAFEMEYRLRRADGQYRWIVNRGTPRYLVDSHFTGYIGSCIDIHDRKRAEDAVREQRELLQVTLSSIGDAVIATDTRGAVTFMNPIAEALTGWSQAEAIGKPVADIFDIINEQTRRAVENPATRVLREHAIVGLANHTILRRRDGTEIPIDNSGAPIQDGAGQTVGVILVFRDITERKQVELSQRLLAEAGRLLAASLDYESRLANVAYVAVPHLADWCTVDVLEEDGSIRQLAVAHVDPAKAELARELRRRYPLDPNAPTGVPNVLRTGQSEFFPEIPDALLEATAQDAEHLKILRELGLKSAMVVPLVTRGRTLGVMTFVWAESDRRYTPDDVALAEELARRAALAMDNARLYQETQQLNAELEQRVMKRTAQLQASHARLENQIAERKQAEEALQRSQRQYEELVNSVEGIVWEGDARTFEFSFVSQQAERLLGYPTARWISEPTFWKDHIHPDDRARAVDFRIKATAEKRPHEFEYRMIAADGRAVWLCDIVTVVVENDQPVKLRGVMTDVTERKRAEAELAEMQRRLMESREAERLHLAQELHDGPVQDLHGISYQLAGLGDMLPDDSRLADLAIGQVRLQQVLQTLRAICGELRPPTLAPFGLEKAIRSHAEHFKEAHPELDLHLDLMSDEQMLPEQVRLALFRVYQQALINVLRHAEASRVSIRFQVDSERAVLEIQDDGRGFAAPPRWIDLARRGHLGLVGAVERAEAVGGQLKIISAPGEGTLIQVSVPHPDEQEANPSHNEVAGLLESAS